MEWDGLTYAQACEVLGRTRRFGIHPSLEGMRCLTAALGNPQRSFRAIQVTGTNGKGSTARMIEAVLRAHGMRIGLFTSPHLSEYAEDLSIGGHEIDCDLFAAATQAAISASRACAPRLMESPTEFELLTTAALWALREAGMEWAVLEVGMGGRWDSTSICHPEVAVVTNVGVDHTEFLGATLNAIARDKAFVIKRGTHAVLGPGTEAVDRVFARRAESRGARLSRVRSCEKLGVPATADACFVAGEPPSVPGGFSAFDYAYASTVLENVKVRGPRYQIENAACALVASALALGDAELDEMTVREALRQVTNPGRFELLRNSPTLVADGAHNQSGAAALRAAVLDWRGARRVTVVLGMLREKEHARVIRELAPIAQRFIVTSPRSDRATPLSELERAARLEFEGPVDTARNVAEALNMSVLAGEDTVVTGSLRTVADAKVWAAEHPGRARS
jgi:dihydrofolate synthase / folylpolyglutamate synthase